MAFRADEAEQRGFERAKSYLIGKNIPLADRAESHNVLLEIIDKCGPVVDSYPTWHPLVSNHNKRNPEIYPSDRCGYDGLDHNFYFAHGFITCPYANGDEVLRSVSKISHHCAYITAEKLDVSFYNTGTVPILIHCEWAKPLQTGKYVPKRLAVPLMIEQELPMWRWSELAERWDVMRPYLLGNPHGSRSSLFVDQDTAMAMKKVLNLMNESGMFGPLKMG